MDNADLKLMKVMAWERAKAELRSMALAEAMCRLRTQTATEYGAVEELWLKLDKIIEEFISRIEDGAMQE